MWIFIDAISGEYYYENIKDIPYSMMGEYMEVNKTIDNASALVLLSDSETKKLKFDGIKTELKKL